MQKAIDDVVMSSACCSEIGKSIKQVLIQTQVISKKRVSQLYIFVLVQYEPANETQEISQPFYFMRYRLLTLSGY